MCKYRPKHVITRDYRQNVARVKVVNNLNELKIKNLIKAGEPINGLSDGGSLTFTLSAKGTATWVLLTPLTVNKRS